MTPEIQDLLQKLREKMGFALPQGGDEGASDADGGLLSTITEAIHTATMVSLALLRHKNNHVRDLCVLSREVLRDPSLENHAKCQKALFAAYRDIYGQVFPIHHVGKDLIPLYLRKYQQVLDGLMKIARMSPADRKGEAVVGPYTEALTFLVNQWSGSVVVLHPSPGVMEGAQMEPLPGTPPLPSKMRSVPNKIRRGLYLVSGAGQPVPLYPFFHLSDDGPSILRMVTSDGAFYRRLGQEGYNLLFENDLLMELGEFLLRMGAYDRALNLYRLVEHENRQAAVLVSALHHCLNARDHSKRGEAAKAAGEWELCLTVKGDVPILYHELAGEYLSNKQYTQATATISKLLERFPVSDEGYMSLGEIYTARGDFGRALRAFEKALVLNPHHPDAAKRKKEAQKQLDTKKSGESEKKSALPQDILCSFTQLVQRKGPQRLVGREQELCQLLEILSCKDKHNALIVGEAGVGKTVLVEELTRRLSEEGVPEGLSDRKITSLNLGALIAGARFRGQYEERILEAVRKMKESGDLVLIENIHQIISTGTTRGGSLDAASLLKPALVRGDLQVVGTTDEESFANVLEKDPAFIKLFHVIRLEELNAEEVRDVIRDRLGEYQFFHGVRIASSLVEGCLELVKLSIHDRALPESVLDLMDRSASRVALQAVQGSRESETVEREDLLHTLSEMSGISYERLALLQRDRLSRMEELLQEYIIGQDDAVGRVSRVVRAAKLNLDLDPRRPDGVFLFVGPTGVGKTALARALARLLFGDEDKLIRIDMSEYMERISTSRLIGTAPGYVGYHDQTQLTDKVRKNPYSVVLFDEVEKADPQVLNLLLQVFDAGRLTDGKGRTVRFNHATIILTSNLGAGLFAKDRLGFGEGSRRGADEEAVLKEVRNFFTPEFMNRLDDAVVFGNLDEECLVRIVELQLEHLRSRLQHEGKALRLSEEARRHLAREGYSFEYGARNLGRTLRKSLSEPLAMLALRPEWAQATGIEVTFRDGELRFRLQLQDDDVPFDEYAADGAEREGEE